MTSSRSDRSSWWEQSKRNDMKAATYSLTLDEFRSYAKQGNLIPLFREILADHDTPVSAFAKIDHGPSAYLLESIQGGEKWARYSFLGSGSPLVIYEDRGDLCVKKGSDRPADPQPRRAAGSAAGDLGDVSSRHSSGSASFRRWRRRVPRLRHGANVRGASLSKKGAPQYS